MFEKVLHSVVYRLRRSWTGILVQWLVAASSFSRSTDIRLSIELMRVSLIGLKTVIIELSTIINRKSDLSQTQITSKISC